MPIVQKIINKEKVQTKRQEVFGFAPYWNFDKLDSIDFSILTTIAYFDIPVDAQGNLDKNGYGYQTFMSGKATELFNKARNWGTRVVLTLTQMNNLRIESLMDNPDGQQKLIKDTVSLVKERGINGVNIDFEYTGDPGEEYRQKFSQFIALFSQKLHASQADSQLTVSVYASAVKDPKIYDISKISQSCDGVFMMAYDFASYGADSAQPTSPLYGHKEGKYWYDISTAVDDFLGQMPAEKLILGLPWYGYEYPVYTPGNQTATYKGYYYSYWYGRRKYWAWWQPPTTIKTYAVAQDEIEAEQEGWDDVGQVGWKAYQADGIWRMLFLDDVKSLKIKYQFAKQKSLAGVGIWALGFEKGKTELWSLLRDEFGLKISQNSDNNKTGKDNI